MSYTFGSECCKWKFKVKNGRTKCRICKQYCNIVKLDELSTPVSIKVVFTKVIKYDNLNKYD